jgi:hypothetical protein
VALGSFHREEAKYASASTTTEVAVLNAGDWKSRSERLQSKKAERMSEFV